MINKEKIHKFEIENDCTLRATIIKKYGQKWKSLNLSVIKNGVNTFISNKYIPIIESYNTRKEHNIHANKNIAMFEQENNCTMFSKLEKKYGERYRAKLKEVRVLSYKKYKFVLNDDLHIIEEYCKLSREENIVKSFKCSILKFEQENNCTQYANIERKYGRRAMIFLQDFTDYIEYNKSKFVPNCYISQIEKYLNTSSDTLKKITRANNISKFEQENNCTLVSTVINKYGQGWYKKILSSVNIISSGMYQFVDNNCLKDIKQYTEENIGNISYDEIELRDYVKSIYNGTIIENSRSIISPVELDIYIPDKKVAIELDGIYWHSVNKGKDKNYHLNKTNDCNKLGIRLIHINDYDWKFKNDICKSIISSSLGIYQERIFARKCIAKEISSKEYKLFLCENHISGAINSKIKYGLYYNNELVQVVGFGKSRFSNEYELHRMCTKKFTQVIGGFSKLIRYSNISNFISFVDRRFYNGDGYFKLGFKQICITPPSYSYYKGNIHYNRMHFQKYKLQKYYNEGKIKHFDINLTEQQNMINNNYSIIYDCGNLKLKYST